MFTTDDGQRSQTQNGYTIIAPGAREKYRISDAPARQQQKEALS